MATRKKFQSDSKESAPSIQHLFIAAPFRANAMTTEALEELAMQKFCRKEMGPTEQVVFFSHQLADWDVAKIFADDDDDDEAINEFMVYKQLLSDLKDLVAGKVPRRQEEIKPTAAEFQASWARLNEAKGRPRT
jgi:hypothetical protein